MWNLDEQRTMLRDSARSYLGEQQPITVLRKLRDTNDVLGYSPEGWKAFAQLGYAGMLVPEAHGGLGLGLTDAALVAEQMGHTLTALPYLSTAVLAATVLKASANAALQAQWLPRIATADAVLAVATEETPRASEAPLATTAERQAQTGGWVLNGSKQLVIDGAAALALLVAARDAGAPGGVVWLCVPAGAPGVTIERVVMADAHLTARVQLHNVAVAADGLIATGEVGAQLLAQVRDVGRVMTAAELVGVSDEVFARTVTYLKERKQFGKLIGEFQALQHRAAHLYSEIEVARATVMKAQELLDQGSEGAKLMVSVAKAKAGRAANLAVREGVQMHGGIGMTDEYDIGLYMKRDRALAEYMGDVHYHIDQVARMNGY